MEISIVVPKDYRNQLQKMGNTIAKNIAVMARDAITTEAAYAVDMFYAAFMGVLNFRPLVWQMFIMTVLPKF